MSDGGRRGDGRHQDHRSRLRRAGPVAVAFVLVGVLAAACGGGPASPGAGHTGSQKSELLPFSACIRAHGVPNFPDPRPAGGFARSALNAIDVQSPQFRSAEKACSSLAIASGFEHTPAELQKHIEQLIAQDACIRKHGVPNMPGPNAQGQQSFPSGITPETPVFQAAEKVCAYLNP